MIFLVSKPARPSPISRSQTPPISKMDPVEYKSDSVKIQTPTKNPFSPERRTRSYDSNLDQLDDMEPLTPTKKRSGIFGSFEKGIDQVRLLLTPKKDKEKAKGESSIRNTKIINHSEPRKVKAVSNVSRVSRKDPKIVLENVHQVVSSLFRFSITSHGDYFKVKKMGIPNRVRGWIIRCQTRDNMGEVSYKIIKLFTALSAIF